MSLHRFIDKRSEVVSRMKLSDIKNYITYKVLKDCIAFYKNQKYFLKKDDILISENVDNVKSFVDKLLRLVDSEDIIETYIYMGNQGYLEVPLDRDSLTPLVLTFNPITKELEWGPGGGGGGTLSILDEGVIVNAATDTLNFIGVDVLAQQDGTMPNQVNVYIPPPSYPSHFNTNDGIGDARLSDISTTNRYISSPIVEGTPFNIGSWNGGDVRSIIKDASIGYSNPSDFLIEDLTTNIIVEVLDADGITVKATNSALNISGNSDNTTDGIRIQITSFGASAVKYKARAVFTLDMNTIMPTAGRFSIRITHQNSTDGTYVFTQDNLFYDNDDTTAVISGMTIAENAGNVVVREISGVESYTTGSRFEVDIADIDNINNYSYVNYQIQSTAVDYGLPTINIFETDITGWTSVYNAVDLTYSKNDWAVSANNFCYRGNAHGTSSVQDWGIVGTINSPDVNISVNTLNDDANRVYTNFNVETLRLESDYITAWDNTLDLSVADGGTGLQYLCSRLTYPQIDFTTTNPNPGTQPDYSALAGHRYLFRRFWHTNISHSNGLFYLNGNITEDDLTNGDLTLRISLNKTDWFNLNSLYVGGVLSNGDGCRINYDQHGLLGNPNIPNNEIEFTLSLFNTDLTSEWGIYIELGFSDTIRGKQLYLDSFEILNWI